MQTSAQTSRRRGVTVQWLPVELIIEIFRAVQKLIGQYDFELDWNQSMKLDKEYHDDLLAFALSSKEWTAIAQAELFKKVILRNESETEQFLQLMRENKELRSHAEGAVSIRFGGQSQGDYDAEGLDDDLDEIALYCPTVVEISCYRVDVRLEYLRNMKKLDKFNVAFGSILPPSTSGVPIQPVTLAITRLSLYMVHISSPIDPSSLPLVRSLHLYYAEYQPIQPLLPQLVSLHIGMDLNSADVGILIQASTSITSLSLEETDHLELDDASKTVMREKIVELRWQFLFYDSSIDSTLATIINGSKVMKKVILDGVNLSVADQVKPQILETLKVVKEACKKKEIELWKESFEVGNEKVDFKK